MLCPRSLDRLAVCVSLNNDGVTWDPNYAQPSHMHLNAPGHAKMYFQALLDAPFLVK